MKSKRAASLISTAAVYATDRALLKRYINDQLIFLNPLQVHESHEAELERDITDTIKTSRVASAKVKQAGTEEKAPPKKQVIKRPAPEQKSEAIEHLPSSVPSDLDNIIEELYRDLEELKVNRAKLDQIENDLAEQEAVDHAVEKATKKAPSKDTTEDEPSTDEETTSKTEDSTEAKPEDKTTKTDDSSSADNKEETEDLTTEAKPIKASQSRSARSVKLTKEAESDSSEEKKKEDKPKEKKSSTKKATAKKSKAKDKASDSKTSTKAKSTSAKKTTSKKTSKAKSSSKSSDKKEEDKSEGKKEKGETKSPPSKKADQESIIANFIKTNPSISPADASKMKVSSEDLSDHSTELHPDIASEYLAEIYYEQGSYDRAIQIYEALIVRFPEKSVYFADIIKKINEER